MPVYAVDKPLHLTSHDLVARARKLLGTRKVGHAGTLDPLATGVLTLLVGEDTKLSPFLTASEKSYLAWISFGASTPTLDAEGPIEVRGDTGGLREADVERALTPFLELTEQVPPHYSAVKLGGVKGYQAARRGQELELPLRPAGYRRLELLAFAATRAGLPDRISLQEGEWLPDPAGRPVPLPEPLGEFPSALLSLTVAAGTYVRSLARDLGDALGTGAFLSGLLRTRAGSIGLERASEPASLPDAPPLPTAQVLPYPRHTLSAHEVGRVRMGQRLPLRLDGRTVFVDEQGQLVAIAEEVDGRMKLLRVWAAG